ncbi:hypothetical protein FQN53_004568 [Emmonsiellopsis sp. PD_33]|nr:hypothetical protein FQN53_004568 [Emmonsiellopsis sp. PD_33]
MDVSSPVSFPWSAFSGLGSHVAVLATVAVLTIQAWWAISYVNSPLRKYPGPFLAGWTNLWRFFLAACGRYPETVKKLHDKYGPVVRLGPNMLDLDIPQLIRTIYATDGSWVKTDFYHNNSTLIEGQIIYNIFSTTDQAMNARMKKPIVKHYTEGSILAIEPLLDSVIGEFCSILEERFIDGPEGPKAFDLGAYIAYVTWDMVGSVTFSKSFGYMEKGCDFDRTIGIADNFSAIGMLPFLDSLLDKNPLIRIGPPNLSNITNVAIERLIARAQGKDPNFRPGVPDYLQLFLEAKESYPEIVHDGMVMNYIFVNLVAGADTTAIALRAVIYFLIRHGNVLQKVEKEVLAAEIDDIARYSTAKSLPYLEAVVREAMRLHPSVSMPLERYTPKTGLKLPDGSFIPPSTAVGMTPYVISRNRDIWGPDADEFRPERWLQAENESDAAYQERLRSFNGNDLTFGAGSRICLGRHLGLIEVYKIVATLVSRYEMALDDPSRRDSDTSEEVVDFMKREDYAVPDIAAHGWYLYRPWGARSLDSFRHSNGISVLRRNFYAGKWELD